MSKWQPIETAPRDRLLLLFGVYESHERQEVQWMETGWWNQDTATHWMELPPPPSE